MISIIVPVYNVESYVRRCLDSVVEQTYRDLEIIVVDDGSTDGSCKICDEYKRDERVRVFHTENRGLSAARNLGLDEAHGEWIGFVDSDDWIEPDMYEVLIRKAEETGADVVECGYYTDYATEKTVKQSAIPRTFSDTEAVEALIRDEIRTQVWNKIWKSHLFCEIRFPEGRAFEDVATTYKLVEDATVTGVLENSYHWRQRKSSISQSHDQQNLVDYWLAHKQRYEDLKEIVSPGTVALLLRFCAYAIARSWIWNLKSRCSSEDLTEMSCFTQNHFPAFGLKSWPLGLRIIVFLSRFRNNTSFVASYLLNQMYITIKPTFYK